MNKYILVMVASLSLIACASTAPPAALKSAVSQNKNPETQPVKAEANVKPTAPDASVNKLAEQERLAAERLAEQKRLTAEKLAEQARLVQQLKKESVYFDFDKSDVKSEFQNVIKEQEGFSQANKNDTVTLEGNCDERGSSEYNLALGDRRAQSVSRKLQIIGLQKERINTVSNGEEKPRLTCHEESCWKENRRVDFIHNLN